MICPKCGNEVDLFADKCLSCGMSFKSMSITERKKATLENSRKSSPRGRVEYNNDYATVEGMSIRGTRMKKGSFKRRNNNEKLGFSFPVNSLNHD